MLCSHDELGLTASDLGYEPEYGILVLPSDTPVGADIKDIFGLNEHVVEFEITSNRPDCFSVIGLARETADVYKRQIQDVSAFLSCLRQEFPFLKTRLFYRDGA